MKKCMRDAQRVGFRGRTCAAKSKNLFFSCILTFYPLPSVVALSLVYLSNSFEVMIRQSLYFFREGENMQRCYYYIAISRYALRTRNLLRLW